MSSHSELYTLLTLEQSKKLDEIYQDVRWIKDFLAKGSNEQTSEYYTPKEVAVLLNISLRTFWVYLHEHEYFGFTKSGRKYLIKKSDVESFMESRHYYPQKRP
jgi:excisionase family DNA binding protein